MQAYLAYLAAASSEDLRLAVLRRHAVDLQRAQITGHETG